MDKNKEFVREHGETIRVALRNSKLTPKLIKQRTDFIRRSLKTTEDKDMFDTFEERLLDIMNTVGKDKFKTKDLDLIICQALGVETRNYDKSHLINLERNEIKSLGATTFKEMKPYTYGDTTITPIGVVTHKETTGLEDFSGVTYYRVDRKDTHGRKYSHKVFSRINIMQLENDLDYREAVIYGLLDENNITKTNCGGYIGSIQTVEEGKSLPDTVNVNDKYSIVYDDTDANVIANFRVLAEKQRKAKEARKAKADEKGDER